jgi:AcrR family transcriptional regulator
MSAVAGTATRERLLAAAREIVEQEGYGAASVLAIADRAGLAAGTLYRHFACKQELFVELFRMICDGEQRAMTEAWEAGEGRPAIERLQEVLATFARRALRNPRLAWALLAEAVDPSVDRERLAYRARYTALVATAVQAAIDAGEVPDQDVAFIAAAIVGGCGEALVGPLSPLGDGDGPASSQRRVVEALSLFVHRAVGARENG